MIYAHLCKDCKQVCNCGGVEACHGCDMHRTCSDFYTFSVERAADPPEIKTHIGVTICRCNHMREREEGGVVCIHCGIAVTVDWDNPEHRCETCAVHNPPPLSPWRVDAN